MGYTQTNSTFIIDYDSSSTTENNYLCDICFLPLFYFHILFQFMLLRTQDPDEFVSLEACEFWLSMAEQPVCREVLLPNLERLAPVLCRGMKYGERDIFSLQGDIEEDAHIPDKVRVIRIHESLLLVIANFVFVIQESDIRPRFHKKRVRTTGQGSMTAIGDEEMHVSTTHSF